MSWVTPYQELTFQKFKVLDEVTWMTLLYQLTDATSPDYASVANTKKKEEERNWSPNSIKWWMQQILQAKSIEILLLVSLVNQIIR